jgi:hypothetical protein
MSQTPSRLATLLLHLFNATQGKPRPSPCFLQAQAGLHVPLCFVFKVRLKLLIEFCFYPLPSEQAPQPEGKISDHHASPVRLDFSPRSAVLR